MKIFLDTYGCAINSSDSNIIRGILSRHDFVRLEDADLVIVNSCAVKLQTESKIVSAIKKYKAMGKWVILAGCLPRVNGKAARELKVRIVDLDSYHILPQIIDGSRPLPKGERISMPMAEDGTITGIIPLAEGCLGNCAYCGVKNARGTLKSYPEDLIVGYARKLVGMGKKQIFLTAQDTGCYGKDIGTSLVSVLDKILAIGGDFKVRVGMMNPPYAWEMREDLARILSHRKAYSFLHIPVQSGSDSVLRDMRRRYTADEFMEAVSYMRKVKDIAISTDMIVGFPTETDDDHSLSMSLLAKAKPDLVNISKFYPRPNTEAADMKLLPTSTLAKRSVAMSRLCRQLSLETNERFIGRELQVLVTGRTKYDQILARAKNYRQVSVASGGIGDVISVKVKSVTPTLLKA